ncbi:MAG: tRNA (adenosine(37)-N6)-threonylcarbamoyltransferase complex dimerization subunit type 1 TsaB [Longimicrobiales bacterium]
MIATRPLLGLDTSTAIGSVALGDGRRVLAEAAIGVQAKHAESLLPTVDFLLRSAALAPGDIGGVVVAGGPGSFTGVRIAAATAKGLVHALGVPLFAYSGLMAQAAAFGGSERIVCALFDARRAEVYAGAFRFPGLRRVETVLAPCVLPLSELLDRMHETVSLERMHGASGGRVVYTGDGALRHRDTIEAVQGLVPPAHLALPRASALLWLSSIDPEAGRVHDAAGWEPIYLRESGAERMKRE